MPVVVVGVDASPASGMVLDKAVEESVWRGAELHVVHVARVPMVYSEIPYDPSSIIEAEHAAVWERLGPAIEGTGLSVQRVDLDGYPPEALVRYASEINAELLVVGTRGRGDFASLVLGSTSHDAVTWRDVMSSW